MNAPESKRSKRAGIWLLGRLINRNRNYGLFGDLEELYHIQLRDKCRFKANLWLWAQIFRTLPYFITDRLYWNVIMSKNYFKITLRNFQRHKAHSFINLTGLTVGLACCLVILSYVQWELSCDGYHTDADRIYRLVFNGQINDRAFNIACVNNPVAPFLTENFPDVESACRFHRRYRAAVAFEDRRFLEDGILWADASVFDIFSFPLIDGDPDTALKNPFTAVITESTARKYFGEEDPLGKILRLDDETDFSVTGVMRDVPRNSHFSFDILLSFQTRYVFNRAQLERWMGDFNNYVYLRLTEGVNIEDFENRLQPLIDKNMGLVLKAIGGHLEFRLQPLTRIYLHSRLEGELAPLGNITYVYIFSVAAIFILLLAGINFVNLATARSTHRALEVGMRKVHGARRGKLVKQFLGESLIYSFVSLVLALILVEATLPVFRSLSGRALRIPYAQSLWVVPSLLVLGLILGLGAGIWPAFILSGFQPAKVLKGQLAKGPGRGRMRRGLVIFQFAVSTFLIIGTAVMHSQLHFMKNKHLGFDQKRVIAVRVTNDRMQESMDTIKREFQWIPGVKHVAVSSHIPGWGARHNVCLPEGIPTTEAPVMGIINADVDFLPALGIGLAEGRNFSLSFSTDPDQSVLINESAARMFGWQEAVGKKIAEGDGVMKQKTIIGVVRDYHFMSVREVIEPLLITNEARGLEVLSVKLDPGDIPATLQALTAKWQELAPRIPFDFTFLDASFNSQYRTEEQLSRLFTYFSLLAILIAGLGLFGMASYSAEQRTKEIGIRKVLGASAGRLTWMLTREFTALVLAANLIALPLAYWFVRRWLKDFAYRVPLTPIVFLLPVLAVLAVGLITVSMQSLRTAAADPVNSLRFE